MAIDPSNSKSVVNFACSISDSGHLVSGTSIFGKYLSETTRRRIKDVILILFYKVDKIFPRRFRLFVKVRVIKYLIK